MQFATTLVALGAVLTLMAAALQENSQDEREVLYRYTDEHGVKVLNDQIPPRYIAAGYEVLTLSGRILEVVSPELTKEQLSKKQQRETQAENDRKLRMRYNSVADIENARKRKLITVRQDIAALNANLFSLNNQINNSEAAAARAQRNGDMVTPEQLEHIASLREEKQVVQQRLKRRKEEEQKINAEFDQSIERYEALAVQ
ncbi:MAG: hypothetical protein K0U59_06325 [Gammaproteobacteria bacterium]|nr:hypothetical protein [Gammaproteobacteria bacterium]